MKLLPFICASILMSIAAGRAMRCASDAGCPAPLSCVGLPANMRCRMKKGVGMACGKDPFWVYQEGLICESKICRGMVDVGESCSSKFECKEPYLSAGRVGKRKCVVPMPIGGRCESDPKWVCEPGLKCRSNVCVDVLTEVGASCNGMTIRCGQGLRCIGLPGNKRCYRKRTKGETCETPFSVCKKDLRSVGNVCVAV